MPPAPPADIFQQKALKFQLSLYVLQMSFTWFMFIPVSACSVFSVSLIQHPLTRTDIIMWLHQD